jgi:hypothetical protein
VISFASFAKPLRTLRETFYRSTPAIICPQSSSV